MGSLTQAPNSIFAITSLIYLKFIILSVYCVNALGMHPYKFLHENVHSDILEGNPTDGQIKC